MIVEYIRYRIAAGERADFEKAYAKAQSSLRASPHCRAYELSHCMEAPEYYILRIEWDSVDGHLKEFRSSPDFRSFFACVRTFNDNIEEMRHYEMTSIAGQK